MAIDAFLKLKNVEGESTVKGHEKTIDVLAWSWGLSQSGTTHTGKGGGAGKVNVQDLNFTHYLDSASPNLILGCCKGTHYDEATLTLRKAGDKPLDYLKIKLKGVLITSVTTGGSGGEDRLTENVSLNFSHFSFTYQPQNDKGSADGGPKEVQYDIAKNV
jgi:type VI secretion system secreted protein Hcp